MKKRTKILVVDDVATIRALLRQQLSEMGFKNIVDCTDGYQAWSLISQDDNKTAKIELIIADWNMPKVTGLQFTQMVRSKDWGKNIPIIFVTSENNLELVSEAIHSGVSQYIIKPFSINILAEKMIKAWDRHHKKK
jgi:two-component system chemotaxis response regulator CheY